jgi:GLPGLI family protein
LLVTNVKKAIITVPEGDAITVYYTDQIVPGLQNNFEGLKGLAMEFTLNEGGMEITYLVTKVEETKVDKNLFEIPSDYEEMEMDDFMKSMGQ